MKYRFFSLEQVLQSPLFDLAAPYRRPEYTPRCTSPAKLESMLLQSLSGEAGRAQPLLADVFHLLYAQEHRLTEPSGREPLARTLHSAILDALLHSGGFHALRTVCVGNETAALEAAQAFLTESAGEFTEMAASAGRLIPVLERLHRRHDAAERQLHRLADEAQANPDRVPDALRAAAETAGTAEQIRTVSGMISDSLRRRRQQTARAVAAAVEKSREAARLAAYAVQCWGGISGGPAQQAEHHRALLEQLKGNEMLAAVTRQLGRMKEVLSSLRKNSRVYGRGEKYSLTQGRDLKNLLSGELALLAAPETTPLFVRRFHTKTLRQYARREPVRMGGGDLIVCLDESGSTEGENAAWGKALALALQDICAGNGRKFALIHFSDADEIRTDLFLPGQYGPAELLDAAAHFFGGMTDFEAPLREALRVMEDGSFEDADIVFITDGRCRISEGLAQELQEAVDSARCTVIGLLLDMAEPGMAFSLEGFCERVLRTSEVVRDEIEGELFAGIAG